MPLTLRPRFVLASLASIAAVVALPYDAQAATPPTSPTSPTLLGFTDDLMPIARAAPAVQGTSQVARIPLYWTGVAQNGWGQVDAAVVAARASGQQVLIAVTGVAAPDLVQWALFLRTLHARYPDLWGVQAWNEPNLENIGGLLSVQQTAAIVQTAHEALPGVRVIGPSVSPTVAGASEYQTELYAALPDDIGVGVNIFTYRKDSGIADVVSQYRKAKADGGAAEVYVTELGFHGAYFTDQAINSGQAFGALRAEGAAAVIYYRLLTDSSLTAAWELAGRFNVLNDDLTPTPILPALQRALVDTTAPRLRVRKVELNPERRSAKIKFSVPKQVGVTCILDKKTPKPCSSPLTYKRLDFRKHKLSLTAMDEAGNSRAATKKFKLTRS